jgi:hypothetical protein
VPAADLASWLNSATSIINVGGENAVKIATTNAELNKLKTPPNVIAVNTTGSRLTTTEIIGISLAAAIMIVIVAVLIKAG